VDATLTRRFVSLVSLLAAMCMGVKGQASPALTGRVVAEATGRPLSGASVQLVSDTVETAYRATTGSTGAFRFDRLAPGPYRLIVTHPVYLDNTYGGGVDSTLLQIAPGHPATVEVALTHGSAITGRILDELGDPMFGVNIEAYQTRRDARGLVLSRVAALAYPTNDLGQFRLARLAPGDYFIAASTRRDRSSDGGGSIVWFPGVSEVSRAQPIRVSLGHEVTGADFVMRHAANSTVSGVVTHANGAPASNGTVRLVQRDGHRAIVNTRWFTRLRVGGTFSIADVPPGVYQVSAESEETDGSHRREFSFMPMSLQGDDLSIFIQLRKAAHVRGRVEGTHVFEGLELSVVGRSREPSFANDERRTAVGIEGAFDLELPPGRWALAVHGLPALAAITRIVGSGRDLRDDITVGTRDIDDLHIGIERFGSALSGTVTAAARADHPAVVLMAETPILHPNAVAGTVVTRVTGDQFIVQNLLPGTYSIVATDLEEPGVLLDPAYRNKLLQEARSISLTPGRSLAITLPLRTPTFAERVARD
jgi:hypothetical protein